MINTVWYQMTILAYHKSVAQGHDHMKYRYVKEIAESLLENLPNSAHLYALERINTIGELQTDMWRQVLTELDKLEALNAIGGSTEVGGSVDGHISRRQGEPHEAQQESSDADVSNAWTPSTPSGADESAL